MAERTSRVGTWVTTLDTGTLLVGLAADAALHRLDSTPAERDGLLGANPGHALAAGGVALVGVLFLMPYGVPGAPVGGPLTTWHAHDNVCADPATYRPVGATDAAGQCPAGAVRRTSPEMLNVWVADNPGGVFDCWMQPPALQFTDSWASGVADRLRVARSLLLEV